MTKLEVKKETICIVANKVCGPYAASHGHSWTLVFERYETWLVIKKGKQTKMCYNEIPQNTYTILGLIINTCGRAFIT